jgi:hypothetical protein
MSFGMDNSKFKSNFDKIREQKEARGIPRSKRPPSAYDKRALGVPI